MHCHSPKTGLVSGRSIILRHCSHPSPYTHHQQHQTLHLVEQCPQTKPILLSGCGYEEAYNMRRIVHSLRQHASRTLFCIVSFTNFPKKQPTCPKKQPSPRLSVASCRGGVPVGGITELVGPAGVGKSQLCHMLTVSAFIAQQQQDSNAQVRRHDSSLFPADCFNGCGLTIYSQ